MHELSIVFHIVKTLESLSVEKNIKHISNVTLEVGEVSAVLGDYLEDCWNWTCNKHELLKGCTLTTKITKAYSVCLDCGKKYSTVKYGIPCPKCGSKHTELLVGKDVVIKDIAVD